MKELHIMLKHKWYDMTASGVKKEEYREIKPYYSERFNNNDYTDAVLHRGYTNTTIRKKIAGITIGIGNPAWGAPADKVYIIKWKDYEIKWKDYEEETETNTMCSPRS